MPDCADEDDVKIKKQRKKRIRDFMIKKNLGALEKCKKKNSHLNLEILKICIKLFVFRLKEKHLPHLVRHSIYCHSV